MVHTGQCDRRIYKTEERSSDEAKGVVYPGDSSGEKVSCLSQNRSYDDEGQEGSNKDGDQWGGQVVEPGRGDFVKTLLDICNDPGNGENRKYSALVADSRDMKSEDVPYRRSADTDLVSTHQIRVNHNHTHCSAEVRVTAEFLCGTEADQNRQEGERCCREQVDCGCKSCPLRIQSDD